jgi:hypothetical protein
MVRIDVILVFRQLSGKLHRALPVMDRSCRAGAGTGAGV